MPQITINIPADAVPRIKAATRRFFPQGANPDDPPNVYPEPTDAEYLAFVKEEIKRYLQREVRDFERQEIKRYLQREVRDFERREAARAAEEAVTDIEVLD
jgi:hypothetical protein